MKLRLPVTLIPVLWLVVGLIVGRIIAASFALQPAFWYGAQAAGALIGFVGACLVLKSSIVRIPETRFEIVRTQAERFPGVDVLSLQQNTEALTGLGFIAVLDYTTNRPVSFGTQGYARLFFDRERQCYAEINQVASPVRGIGPIGTTIMTLFDDGWSFYCSNRVPAASVYAAAIQYAMRMPRTMYVLMPGASASALLERHLSLRRQMQRDMPELRISRPSPPDSYFEAQKQRQSARAAAARRKNILLWLLDVDTYMFRPKSTWLGEYGRRFPNSARAIEIGP